MIDRLGFGQERHVLRCALALLAGLSAPASAQSPAPEAVELVAGQQRISSSYSGELRVAGKNLAFDGFSGILGMSSEFAYVVVVDGSASDGTLRARRGEMLLIPPYGRPSARQRFDAQRLLAGLSEQQRASSPALADQLARIAASQKRGLFLGRLGRTSFNAAAPGDGRQELAARTVKGTPLVQSIRFSGETDPAAIERKVVDGFLTALAAGDVEGVAALMDPVPFGNSDLGGGADDARRLMARSLIDDGAWPALLKDAQPARTEASNIWTVSGPNGRVTLTLRPMGDFVFIRTIALGDPS